MFGSNKGLILYLENVNGRSNEIVVKPNIFNKQRLFSNDLCLLEKGTGGDNYYFWKNPNLEYVYFKNFIFDKSVRFGANEFMNVCLVFDNCTFMGKSINFEYLDNVQLINPTFGNNDKISIHSNKVTDFDVILDSSNNKNKLFEFKVSVCDNFEFKGNDVKANFFVDASNVYMDGIRDIDDRFIVVSNNLNVLNSNICCRDQEYEFINIGTNNINFVNSVVSCGKGVNKNCLYFDKISGQNYEIKFNGVISVNGDNYFGNKNQILFSDRLDLDSNVLIARRNVIAVLKSVRDLVNREVDSSVDLVDRFWQNEINWKKMELKRIEEESRRCVNSKKRELVKKKIVDFI